MIHLPPRVPADKTPMSNWLQYLVRWVTSERVIQIMGFTVKQTSDGKFFVPANVIPATPSGSTLVRYKDDLGDCLKCVKWDYTNEGATAYIAKPRKIRTTIASETIQGNTYNYTYALGAADVNGNHYLVRSTTGAVTETDYITPPYVFNDELWAITIPSITLNGNACTLMDQDVDGRAWGE